MVITNKADIEIIGFYSTIMALVDDYDKIRKFIWIIEKVCIVFNVKKTTLNLQQSNMMIINYIARSVIN